MNSINAVLLMGGKGERFSRAGYTTSKPFIPIHGVPMFRRVLENIYSDSIHRIYIVLHQAHLDAAQQATESLPFFSQLRFKPLRQQTRGSAETLLALSGMLPAGESFFTINCDQLIAGGLDACIQKFFSVDSPVMIPVFENNGGPYLRVRKDEERVTEIGRDLCGTSSAAAGVYFFRSFEFISTYLKQTLQSAAVDEEPCITNILGRLLLNGHSIITYDLGEYFTPLGSPKDLQTYITA